MSGLPLDGYVLLDPAVTSTELAPRRPSIHSQAPPVRRGWLLVHSVHETAAVVPPGNGLGPFVEELRTPTPIASLVEPDEVDTDAIAWQLVEQLLRRGHAYRWSEARMPSESELVELRARWRTDARHVRQLVRVSADTTSVDELVTRLAALAPAPSVVLVCADERDHELVAQLARHYGRGAFVLHDLVVELSARALTTPALRADLRRLGAAVRLRDDPNMVTDLATVEALVADRIAVTVALDRVAHLPSVELARTLADAHVTTVELELDWDALARAAATEAALLAHIEELTAVLGDVRISGVPTDDEIAGNAVGQAAAPRTALERATRTLYLERRATHLLELEGKIIWGQDPDAEERWVPSAADLLPNQPSLLGLTSESTLVDVGGGFGRVARRLAPHAARVISIEKESIISARARRFAAERGVRTIDHRVGLGQRLPLADASADAAVLEWGGEIHRDGLLARCVAEMTRVIRIGGRIAITYRLCNVVLERLTEVVAPYPDIYPTLLAAVQLDGLELVTRTFWASEPQLSGAPLAAFEERYLPRLVDDLRGRTLPAQPASVDLTATVIVQKRA